MTTVAQAGRTAPGIQPVVADTVATGQALDQGRLNRYLIRHNEYAASGGIRGVLPYVRVISQDDSRPLR